MDPQHIQTLLTKEAHSRISALVGMDPYAISLSARSLPNVPSKVVAEQVACRKKAVRKLPTITQRPFLYTLRALEQCSSEATARYKCHRLKGGHRAIDATGGLGIDALHLATVFDRVDYCEADGELVELFRANTAARGVGNIVVHPGNALETISGLPDNSIDLLYVDPSRRPAAGGRVVALEKCDPNVVDCMPLFLRKAARVCVKVSPLLEPSYAVARMPGINSVEIISVDGECREQLLHQERDHTAKEAVEIRAVLLTREGALVDTVAGMLGQKGLPRTTGSASSWLYDPDPAITKARLTDQLAARLGLTFLNDTVDYLTSSSAIPDFPGRMFTVVEALPWSRRSICAYLRSQGVEQANIARREFPMTPEKIRAMLGLREGGNDYLFFTRNNRGTPITLHCRRPDLEP